MIAGAGPVAAVVVNWNGAERSVRCLESVRRSWPEALLVLVDNGSSEDPAPSLRGALPGAVLVGLASNRGYAAGCNAGAAAAVARGARYLLFLNNDTTVDPGAIAALLDAAQAHPGCILGPKIVHADDPEVVWSAGGYVVRPLMSNHHVGKGDASAAHRTTRAVDWATGCALFVGADTFERVGAWDEGYFLYLEDTDWCLRAARLGIRTLFVADAVVRHEVSKSVEALPSWHVRYYAYRNHYRLALRHARAWARPLVVGDALWTLAKAGLRSAGSPRHRHDSYYHARTRAVADFLRGRDGPATVAR